jgi:hypothetical protein
MALADFVLYLAPTGRLDSDGGRNYYMLISRFRITAHLREA